MAQQISTQDRVFAFNVNQIRGFPATLQPYLNNNQWQVLASGVMGARDDCCGGFFGCKSRPVRIRGALTQVNNLYFQGKPFFTADGGGDIYISPGVMGGFIQGTAQSEPPKQNVPIHSQQQINYQQSPGAPSAPVGYGDPNQGYGGQPQNYGAPPPGAYPNQGSYGGDPNYGAQPNYAAPNPNYGAPPPGAYPNQGSYGTPPPMAVATVVVGSVGSQSTPNPNYGAPQPASPTNYGSPAGSPPPPNYGAPPPNYGAPPPNYGAPPPNYGAPPPNYGAPPPNYGAPPPNYGAPPPNYGAPPVEMAAAVGSKSGNYAEEDAPNYAEEDAPPDHGSAEYVVPEGIVPGSVVKVQAPNGDYVSFTVPEGATPGAVISYNY